MSWVEEYFAAWARHAQASDPVTGIASRASPRLLGSGHPLRGCPNSAGLQRPWRNRVSRHASFSKTRSASLTQTRSARRAKNETKDPLVVAPSVESRTDPLPRRKCGTDQLFRCLSLVGVPPSSASSPSQCETGKSARKGMHAASGTRQLTGITAGPGGKRSTHERCVTRVISAVALAVVRTSVLMTRS